MLTGIQLTLQHRCGPITVHLHKKIPPTQFMVHCPKCNEDGYLNITEESVDLILDRIVEDQFRRVK